MNSTQKPDLRTAAQAVIDRWETPKWKDAPATAEYIAALRDALAAERTAAGQEPVATVFTMEALTPGGGVKYHATIHKPLPAGTKLYAAPQPAVATGWVMLPGQLPEPGKPVLLDIGKKFPIRAMWAAKHTVQAADDDTDWGEYDEATDTYYAPEGWYEWNQHEDNHWAVTETPRAWCELPQTPPAPSTEGEANG